MDLEPRWRRPAARRRPARGLGPARLRAADRQVEPGRIPHRRSRQGDRGRGPAALTRRPALLRSVSPNRAALALLCGALVLLPGCGSSNKGDPIPTAQADKLVNNIQAAEQYSADGRCSRARTKVRDARFVLGQVPTSVDSDLRQGLADGLDHLDSLIGGECQPPEKTSTQDTQTETTQSQTTPTVTTQTETTQSQTTPTQTQTTPTSTVPTSTSTTPTSTPPTTTTGTGGTPPPPGQGQGQGDG